MHVVEADDRVGGRIWTASARTGEPLNWGATFVGPGQDRVLALAAELGVDTYRTWDTGKNVQEFSARCSATRAPCRRWTSSRSSRPQRVIGLINSMARGIDPAQPVHPRVRRSSTA